LLKAMLGRLLLLFILLPLADLTLLMYLATKIGWQTSLVLVLVSGIAATWLIRRSYREVVRKMQEQSARGELPLGLMSDSAMIFLAGGLLLSPGFITDALGITLLFPRCRRWYRAKLVAWAKKNWVVEINRGFTGSSGREDYPNDCVDGEIIKPPPKRYGKEPSRSPDGLSDS
jgi:UPF0716 protein FxsA